MSDRSKLRAEAMRRDNYSCRWPGCEPPFGPLEMAHLKQLSQGGPDELSNVVMLCRHHHGVLDNRVQNGRRAAVVELLIAYLETDWGWVSP